MVQPEKNTVPLPRVPLIHGSSPKCGAILATTGRVPMPQKPSPLCSVRKALQARGHKLQIITITVFPRILSVYSIAHFDGISNSEIRQIILDNILKMARLDHQLIEQPHKRFG